MSDLFRALAGQAMGRASGSVRAAASVRSSEPLGLAARGDARRGPQLRFDDEHSGDARRASPGPSRHAPASEPQYDALTEAPASSTTPQDLHSEALEIEPFGHGEPPTAPTLPSVRASNPAATLNAVLAWVSGDEPARPAEPVEPTPARAWRDRARAAGAIPAPADGYAARDSSAARHAAEPFAAMAPLLAHDPGSGVVPSTPGVEATGRRAREAPAREGRRLESDPFPHDTRFPTPLLEPRRDTEPQRSGLESYLAPALAGVRHRDPDLGRRGSPTFRVDREVDAGPEEVHVHIGRIELTAVAEPAPRRPAPARPSTSLRDYLNGTRRSS